MDGPAAATRVGELEARVHARRMLVYASQGPGLRGARPVDDGHAGEWFRYHHLLEEFLRLELRRTLPEHMPTLHRRAAEWFTWHGEVADAIEDSERRVQKGAVLAREIGRPCLEVSCLARLGFASKIHPFATARQRARRL